jgi:hypothetical protein
MGWGVAGRRAFMGLLVSSRAHPCGGEGGGRSYAFGTHADVHMELERDLAAFLRVPAVIMYSHSFSTISSVIPSFSKRGDIIVADRGVNFAIQKGIQISRSTVRWYEHGDYEGLERVLEGIHKEDKKYKRNPTASRRFIITEGVFENDGSMVDLPKVVRGGLAVGQGRDAMLMGRLCAARRWSSNSNTNTGSFSMRAGLSERLERQVAA